MKVMTLDPRPNPKSLKEARELVLMSLAQLSELTEKAVPTLSEIEKRETQQRVKLETISNIAEKMGYTLTYEFVPKIPIENLLMNKAISQVQSELGDRVNFCSVDEIEQAAITLLVDLRDKSKFLEW